jgi:type I restriction enzyme S subunit
MDEMFKQTEIGLIPDDWEIRNLSDTVSYIDYGLSEAIPKDQDFDGVKIVSTADITRSGKLLYSQIRKVIANERIIKRLTLINGDVLFNWRNSPELIGKTTVYSEQTEKHIFASFILRIRCDEIKIHNYFLTLLMNYYREVGVFVKLSRRAVNQANYNRNEIAVLKIPVPKIKEQKKITYILSKIQQAIEKQEQIIKTTQELKKALMQKLFTEGLNNEPQKQTEIGLIPQSWEITKIANCIVKAETRNPKLLPDKAIRYIDVSSVSNETYSIVGHQKVLGKDAPGRARKIVIEGDIIFATIRPTLKRIAKITSIFNDQYCSTAFCVLRCDAEIMDNEYLYSFLQTESFIERIEKRQFGASYPAVRDNDVKEMLIPLPDLSEQKQIGRIFAALNSKMEYHFNKKIKLQDLFKTMLNQLMTGQLRVKDIELEIEKLSTAE